MCKSINLYCLKTQAKQTKLQLLFPNKKLTFPDTPKNKLVGGFCDVYNTFQVKPIFYYYVFVLFLEKY